MDGPMYVSSEDSTSDDADSDSGSESEEGGKDSDYDLFAFKSRYSLTTRSGHKLADLDEDEVDRLKGEMTTEMTDLEKQFLALREQLYYERLNRVEEELNEVRTGKSSTYLQPLEELEENLNTRTEVAEIHRDLKIANIECIYEAEKVAAKQTMDMECRMIAESIRQDLEDKLKRLEEDRNSLDSELWSDASIAGKKKKKYLHSTGGYAFEAAVPLIRDQLNLPDRRRKPVTVSGPYVVYMLRENEILDDYNQIRRASRTSYSGSYCYT